MPTTELERNDDTLGSGINAEPEREGHELMGFRVNWINWDSDFRNTALQPGDLITAVSNQPVTAFQDEHGQVASAPCLYNEASYWEKISAREMQEVTLTIKRNNEQLDIAGRLLYNRFYFDRNSKRSIGPGGPDRLINSGFSGSWMGWYEALVKKISALLNRGWERHSFNNQVVYKELLQEKERVDYLVQHFSGPFATATEKDLQQALACARGKLLSPDEIDLEYRELESQRLTVIKEAAAGKWVQIREELKADTISLKPICKIEEVDSVTGKYVELPWISLREAVADIGKSYAVYGSDREGFYYIPLNNGIMNYFFDAFFRFRTDVSYAVKDRFRFISRLQNEPRMVTFREKQVTGLLLEPVAVQAGDGECVVDLRDHKNDQPLLFAGEEDIKTFSISMPPDDASPETLVSTALQCIKTGHQEMWKQLFSDIYLFATFSGNPVPQAYTYPESTYINKWNSARELIAREVYDARIEKCSPVITVCEADPETGLSKVEQADVWVDYYTLVDKEYRSFMNMKLNRRWRLWRVNQGAWRISEPRGL